MERINRSMVTDFIDVPASRSSAPALYTGLSLQDVDILFASFTQWTCQGRNHAVLN